MMNINILRYRRQLRKWEQTIDNATFATKNTRIREPRTEIAAARLVSTLRVGKPGCAGGKPDFVRGEHSFGVGE